MGIASALPEIRIEQWLGRGVTVTISALGAGSSFSGAGIWKVDTANGSYVLKRWNWRGSVCRLAAIHGLMDYLSVRGCPVPAPLRMIDSESHVLVSVFGPPGDSDSVKRIWSLVRWLPGEATYWREPSPAKLAAAMRALAGVHVAAADFPYGDGRREHGIDCSPAMTKRSRRLSKECGAELAQLHIDIQRARDTDERARGAATGRGHWRDATSVDLTSRRPAATAAVASGGRLARSRAVHGR